MARRRPTAAQIRDHRSKQLAVGLGVIFVIVAVVQVPRLMKQLNPGTPPENAGSGLVAAARPTAAAGSVDAPAGVTSQLDDFSQLPLKDPFRPLVKTPTSASTSSPAAAPSTPPAAAATTRPATAPVAKPKAPVAPAAPTTFIATPPPPPDAALIKLNGHRQLVAIGDPFPLSQPLFTLVSLDKKSVRIGVFAGSFSSGLPTLAVPKGHKVTLVNQVDGSRYVLQLVGLTVAPPTQAQPGATTTTPSVTPAPATPAPATPAPVTPAPTATAAPAPPTTIVAATGP